MIDRVNTTGTVWLGTTLECCQCHDHKYDPFSAKEYYQLLAYFNNTALEADRADRNKPSSIAFNGPYLMLRDQGKSAERAGFEAQLKDVGEQIKNQENHLKQTLATWVSQRSRKLTAPATQHSLRPQSFVSTGKNDPAKILDDGSILLAGKTPPDKDTYTITFDNLPGETTALRLDTLTHPSLPGQGPGRGDKVRNNFVLNRLEASVIRPEQPPRALVFDRAFADFSQKKYDVSGALSRQKRSGWAIAAQFSKPHWAVFVLEKPLTLRPDERLQVRLVHQYGGARSIGRPKLSAITGQPGEQSVPDDVLAAMKKPFKKWTAKELSLIHI